MVLAGDEGVQLPHPRGTEREDRERAVRMEEDDALDIGELIPADDREVVQAEFQALLLAHSLHRSLGPGQWFLRLDQARAVMMQENLHPHY